MVPWPLIPNWSQPVRETFEFRTEVFTSRDGTETRRALRSTPRRTMEYEALVVGERLRSLERLLIRNQVAVFSGAEMVRGTRTTAALPVGGISVDVRAAPTWLIAGAKVLLISGIDARLFTVDEVAGLTVTFTTPSDLAFASGSRLAASVEGRVSSNLTTNWKTDAVATVPVTFEPLPATEAFDVGEIDFTAFYDGREVFLLSPDWKTSPTIEYLHEVERVDYGRGRVAVTAPIQFGSEIRQGSYLHRSAEDALYLLQFFARMKGQRGEFFAPTWTHDLPPMVDLQGDTATLTVAGSEVFDTYADDTVHRAIVVRSRIGFIPMRTVESIALVSGNSVITLTEDWGIDIPLADIISISWMPLSRFATDALTIEWVTDDLARTTLSVRSLQHNAAEADQVGGALDGAALYLLATFGWNFLEYVLCDPLDLAVNGRWLAISVGLNPLGDQLQAVVNDLYPET